MRILLIAAFLLLLGCTQQPSEPTEGAPVADVATSSTGEMYALEPDELATHIARAKAGDNAAAVRVAEHFAFAELSTTDELRWLLVAAERGHIGAMRSLSHHYASELSGHKDCSEALKWLERAKREANPAELKQHGIVEQLAYVRSSPDACPQLGVAE